MENRYLESLAFKYISGQASKEETLLLHLWYDATDVESAIVVNTATGEDEWTTSKRLFAGIRKAGGGRR